MDAHKRQVEKVLFLLDIKVYTEVLNNKKSLLNWHVRYIMEDILKLSKGMAFCTFVHVNRQVIGCVDLLVEKGQTSE